MNKVLHCPDDNKFIAEILSKVESTEIMDPRATLADVKRACDHAIKYHYGQIVPFTQYLPAALEYLKGSSVRVVLGSTDMQLQEERLFNYRTGLEMGAKEIDIVGRMSLFFEKKYDEFQREINETASLGREFNAPLKVIIETGYLTDEEKILAARLALEAGATFIKCCLGMGRRKGRGTIHDVLLLKDAFGDDIKIKASGAIPSLEDAAAMIRAGADRIALRGVLATQLAAINYVPDTE